MRANVKLAPLISHMILGCHPMVDSNQNASITFQTLDDKKIDQFVETPIPFEDRMRKKFQYHSSHGDVTVITTKFKHLSNTRRNLRAIVNENSYSPLRLRFEVSNLNQLRDGSAELDFLIEFIIDFVIPQASNVWSSMLSVNPTETYIPISNNTCFNEINIPPEYIKTGVKNADLAIFATGGFCPQKETIASAFPCALNNIDDRPVVGLINFCLNNFKLGDAPNLQAELKKFTEITVHELGHILGMNSDLFPFFHDPKTGNPLTPRPMNHSEVTCTDGKVKTIIAPSSKILKKVTTNSGRYFEIVTPTVVNVSRNQFNCYDLIGARLEDHPSSAEDCYGSHWDERLFFTEIMSATRNSAQNILSPLTLALLEDSGWYKVNYRHADISPFGYGAGCEFVNEKCIVNGELPNYSKGFFCNTKTVADENGDIISPQTCDPTHTAISSCDLTDLSFEGDQIDNKYFNDLNLGPLHFKEADFCPMAITLIQDCRDKSGEVSLEGVSYGANSKCFNFYENDFSKKSPMAYCLKSECDENSRLLNVVIGENRISCDFDGQIHEYPNHTGLTFECPRLASVCPHFMCPANCSGRGTCDFSLKDPKCICFDNEDNTPGCYGSTLGLADGTERFQRLRMITNAPSTAPSEFELSESTVSPMATTYFTDLDPNSLSTDEENIIEMTESYKAKLALNKWGEFFFYGSIGLGLFIISIIILLNHCCKTKDDLDDSSQSSLSSSDPISILDISCSSKKASRRSSLQALTVPTSQIFSKRDLSSKILSTRSSLRLSNKDVSSKKKLNEVQCLKQEDKKMSEGTLDCDDASISSSSDDDLLNKEKKVKQEDQQVSDETVNCDEAPSLSSTDDDLLNEEKKVKQEDQRVPDETVNCDEAPSPSSTDDDLLNEEKGAKQEDQRVPDETVDCDETPSPSSTDDDLLNEEKGVKQEDQRVPDETVDCDEAPSLSSSDNLLNEEKGAKQEDKQVADEAVDCDETPPSSSPTQDDDEASTSTMKISGNSS